MRLVLLRFALLVGLSSSGILGQGQLSTSDYGESDYDDKDVQFENSRPNLLILLADPKNGTTVPLANQPNSDVVLDRSFEKVHLFCSAYYPIRWTYAGDGFPFLNVDNTRFTEDFYDPTTYAFSALLELEGLKESQTGNYTCHKWDNASFASSYQIFVPGDRILLPENNTKIYVDAAVTQIRIPCSVSDPHANVTLLKYFSKGQGEFDWMVISPTFYSFDPRSGFHFSGQSVQTAIGEFICSVQETHKVHVSVITNNTLAGGNVVVTEDCCDKKYLRSLGDERTSCRGFISERCQSPDYLDVSRSSCKDWKLAEFLKSPVELCKQEIAPANSSVAVGYFSTRENGPRLYMYCQADPKEYTQGFKMAVEWTNGSMVFVDDDRLLVPGLSEFPSGYEVHAEITDLLNPDAPLEPLILHCYIPLKYSFKWIKMLKPIPSLDLRPFAQAWYNFSAGGADNSIANSSPTPTPSTSSNTPRPNPRFNPVSTTTKATNSFNKEVEIDTNLDANNAIDAPLASGALNSQYNGGGLISLSLTVLSLYAISLYSTLSIRMVIRE